MQWSFDVARCALEPAGNWILFGPNVPALVYFTHLPNLTLSLLLAIFVLIQGWRSLPHRILFFTTLAFVTWVFFALMFWASNRSDVIMFAWLMDILVEPLVHIGMLYLLYVLIKKQDLPFKQKLILAILYAPIPILLPTAYVLSGFDVTTCLAIEGPIALYYTYIVEIIATGWLIGFIVNEYHLTRDLAHKKEILYLGIGGVLLLFAFSWGNITGSFTEDWQLGQYGLFGMPLFIGFLVYSIVKFKTFNIKLLAAQALVVALWFLVFALLFIKEIEDVRVVTGITLIVVLLFGTFLVRNVRKEVEARSHIEKLALDLSAANERLRELDQLKSEFVSIASHQLRSPLTAIKGYTSLVLEGSYGKLTEKVRDPLQRIFDSASLMAVSIEDFLNVSRIEQGRMQYTFSKFNLADTAQKVIESLIPIAKKKELALILEKKTEPMVNADVGKIHQVISNLVDNAIKYTPHGSVTVTVSKDEKTNMGMISVKDSGVGIPPESLPKLFGKFSRAKNANSVNVAGTGLGLYVAKQLVEAQKGRIWAESEGEGKGSVFYISLPLKT